MSKRALFLILASGLIFSACSNDNSNSGRQNISGETDLDEDITGDDTGDDDDVLGEYEDEDEKCTGNETACDGYVLLTCGADGKFVHTACNKNEICKVKDGVASCVKEGEEDEDTSCKSGERQCESGKVMVCDDHGNWSEFADCGSAGQICSDEDKTDVKCVGSTVEPKKDCAAGETKCQGDKLMKCSDSFEFVVDVDCSSDDGSGTPKMCSVSGGVASCVETCLENFTRCSETGVLQTCDSTGRYVDTPCTGETEICGYSDGNAGCVEKPKEPECKTGESECTEAKELKSCVGGFWNVTACPLEHECALDSAGESASCVVVPCTDGASKCSERGNKLMNCVEGVWRETKCLELTPVQICVSDGNTESSDPNDRAACVEPVVTSGSAETIDSDGDTIPDKVEGVEENNGTGRDSDGDGIPDYLDLDSDNDTIPDKVEANNHGQVSILPDNADGDDKPNYIDTDSDENGIPDKDEACPGNVSSCNIVSMIVGYEKTDDGRIVEKSETFNAVMLPIDTDGDGDPDYLDYDNDGDGFSDETEIHGLVAVSPLPETLGLEFSGRCNNGKAGSASKPLDCDGDGTPDYMDTDSDNDYLSDVFEGFMMKDGIYARYTVDADGDGNYDVYECYPESKSCNFSDVSCFSAYSGECWDSDNPKDGVPDMLETDSDGDGIPDDIEVILGSDPTNTNTDDDDAPDIVEYAICQLSGMDCTATGIDAGNCTCPAIVDTLDSPVQRGDFVFTTPYKKPSSPENQTLSLETSIQTIDLFYIFDSSSSMSDERNSLKTSLPKIMTNLKCKEYNKECSENSDCEEFKDDHGNPIAICSEQRKCILNPSVSIDYGKTCTKDANCEEFANAICKFEHEGDTSGKCMKAGCFDNMWTGIGGYNAIYTFFTVQALDPDITKTTTILNSYSWPSIDNEAPYSAVMCAALKLHENDSYCAHKSFTNGGKTYSPGCSTDANSIGCVGFRPNAIRLIIEGLDENQCYANSGNPNGNYWITNKPKCDLIKEHVGEVLQAKKIRYVGLWSESWEANKPDAYTRYDDGETNDLVAKWIGEHSGSVDVTKTPPAPFVYYAKDSSLPQKATEGIRAIAKNMPLDITVEVEDFDDDENLNASKLIDKLVVNLEPNKVAQKRRCTQISNEIDKTTNPKFEGVKNLLPGNVLCYDVYPVQEQDLFPADKVVPKMYKARVKVLGDKSVLNSGVAYFVVPPEPEEANE